MLGTTNHININSHTPFDIIPPMNADEMGEWVSSASGIYDSTSQAFRAFDKQYRTDTSNGTIWHGPASATTGWIQIKNTNNKQMKVTSITFWERIDWSNRLPKAFDLLGSNDGGNTFTTIQSFNGPATNGLVFNVNNYDGYYSCYRIKINSVNGGNAINIAEIRLMGYYL